MEKVKYFIDAYYIISFVFGLLVIAISSWICYEKKIGTNALLYGGRLLLIILVIAMVSGYLASICLKPFFFYVFKIQDEWLASLLGWILSIVSNFIFIVKGFSKNFNENLNNTMRPKI